MADSGPVGGRGRSLLVPSVVLGGAFATRDAPCGDDDRIAVPLAASSGDQDRGLIGIIMRRLSECIGSLSRLFTSFDIYRCLRNTLGGRVKVAADC